MKGYESENIIKSAIYDKGNWRWKQLINHFPSIKYKI